MTLPTLPQIYLDTTYVPPTGTRVDAGSDLQAVLTAANPGDTIVLAAGATYPGPFTLPAKTGAGWIYVQSAAIGSLPSPGVRVSPSHASLMPKILAPSGGSAIQTAPGAHHFRFVGIELCPVAGQFVYAVNDLSAGHDFTFDRCYIHGDPTAGSRRGIAMNAASVAVIDSHVSDFKEVGADSQALTCWNGPGPFKIVNNYLEGAGENLLFGGADPAIPNLVPSDIEIRGNHFSKPLSWMVGNPAYAGTHWEIKNILELKNAQRVLIDGNVLEYNWPDAQNGMSILFTPRNQDGHAPWCIVQDVTFTHNIVRHVAGAFNILGWDNINTALQTQRILIRHNLCIDIGGVWTFGRLFQVLNGTVDVTIDHNTAIQTGDPIAAADKPHTGFTFTNNIALNGTYGVGGDGTYGNVPLTLSTYFPGCTFTKNVMIGGSAGSYPPDNVLVPLSTPVVNAALGGSDYHLVPGSPYVGAGTDGKNLGADIDAILTATANAIAGSGGPPSPPPPPPPPPSPPPPPPTKVWTGTVTATQDPTGKLTIAGLLT